MSTAEPKPSTPHPYADFLHLVQKPARYVGGEYLSRPKDPDAVRVNVCLAFPDLYDIGMSHLGTKILYKILNDEADIACERAFAPWVDMEAQLRERGLPLLSLENRRPLADFDVLGFSLQYELTFTNVLNMLELGGLPLRAAERDERHPLVIAGGPVATHPEPIAPFLDAILIGDAEALLPRSLRLVAELREQGTPRREVLRRLAALGGWYCPALYETRLEPRNGLQVVDPQTSEGPWPVERAIVDDINRYPFPTDSPVAAAEAIFDRMSIEISRGCTEGCRFCQAGMIYRPVRERDPQTIVDTVLAAIDKGGYDEASLTSLSTADYSCVSPLVRRIIGELRKRKVSLGVSSLRAYGLDEDVLDDIASAKATGLTFAPEAGTQRMRDVINKNISDEDLLLTADRVFSRGWQRMKLYFIIGLPSETDEDVLGVVETAARCRDAGLEYHKRRKLQVTASASSHVPKPHTPFQWAAMDSLEEIARKQALLREAGRKHQITVKYHNQKTSYIEGIICRGDRTVADLLESAWRKGCRFDGWDDQMDWEAWQAAIDEWEGDPQRSLDTLPIDGELPWSHIDVGLADGFLEQEYKRALKDRLSPPCGKPKGAQVHHTNLAAHEGDARKLVCYHCGIACDLTQMRSERGDYLERLGAFEPPAPRGPDDLPEHKLVRTNRLGQSLPPRRAAQGPSTTWRLVFTKLEAVRLTSVLDVTRLLPRAVRRAGIDMRYTQGFSPKPVLSFGPALPLGIASLAEIIELQLLGEPDAHEAEALLERLAEVADPGLHFLRAAPMTGDVPALGKTAKLAEYLVAAPQTFDEAALRAACQAVLGDEPLMARAVRKKGARQIDVRDGLLSARVDTPSAFEVRMLGLREDAPLLRWRVDLNTGAHVRATELAEAAFGLSSDPRLRPTDLVAARTGLWGLRKGRVFDLLDPERGFELARHEELPRAATALR